MPVAKIILVQDALSAEVDLIEKTYKGNMPIKTAKQILQPPLLDLMLGGEKNYKQVPE